jgi:hypothetical protein
VDAIHRASCRLARREPYGKEIAQQNWLWQRLTFETGDSIYRVGADCSMVVLPLSLTPSGIPGMVEDDRCNFGFSGVAASSTGNKSTLGRASAFT